MLFYSKIWIAKKQWFRSFHAWRIQIDLKNSKDEIDMKLFRSSHLRYVI